MNYNRKLEIIHVHIFKRLNCLGTNSLDHININFEYQYSIMITVVEKSETGQLFLKIGHFGFENVR